MKKTLICLISLLILALPVFAGRSIDNYMNSVTKKIMQYWTAPKSDKTLKTVICFHIDKNGKVTESEVFTSSGDKNFDNMALDTIKKIGEFDPLPVGYESGTDVYFTFSNYFTDKKTSVEADELLEDRN